MSSTLFIALLELTAGFVLLIWAAGRLVTGASALARNLGVPPLLVGLTIVGFGTSAPEMLVSAMASVRGNPSLAIGNAIGSNIANVGLILGLTALIYPLRVEKLTMKREFPILGIIMLLTLAVMWNFSLSRLDGLLMAGGLAALVGGMVYVGLRNGRKDPMAASLSDEVPDDMSTRAATIWTLLGLVMLPLKHANAGLTSEATGIRYQHAPPYLRDPSYPATQLPSYAATRLTSATSVTSTRGAEGRLDGSTCRIIINCMKFAGGACPPSAPCSRHRRAAGR